MMIYEAFIRSHFSKNKNSVNNNISNMQPVCIGNWFNNWGIDNCKCAIRRCTRTKRRTRSGSSSGGEELQAGPAGQNQNDQSATPPNGLSLRLDRAHFILLTLLSDSPGNQVKMLLDYNIEKSSPFLDDTVNAIMEVYAANQTLLRTSSLPEPIVLDDLEGTIQLATTLDDPTLKDENHAKHDRLRLANIQYNNKDQEPVESLALPLVD